MLHFTTFPCTWSEHMEAANAACSKMATCTFWNWKVWTHKPNVIQVENCLLLCCLADKAGKLQNSSGISLWLFVNCMSQWSFSIFAACTFQILVWILQKECCNGEKSTDCFCHSLSNWEFLLCKRVNWQHWHLGHRKNFHQTSETKSEIENKLSWWTQAGFASSTFFTCSKKLNVACSACKNVLHWQVFLKLFKFKLFTSEHLWNDFQCNFQSDCSAAQCAFWLISGKCFLLWLLLLAALVKWVKTENVLLLCAVTIKDTVGSTSLQCWKCNFFGKSLCAHTVQWLKACDWLNKWLCMDVGAKIMLQIFPKWMKHRQNFSNGWLLHFGMTFQFSMQFAYKC